MPKKAIQLSDHFTYSRLLRFVLPCIGTMLFTSIYGIVDGLCVSNFVGKTAFAAVNLIMPLPQLLGTVGFMLGTGGSAIVGITLGEGDQKKADRYFSMFMLAALVSVSVLSVLGILLLRPVAVQLGAKGELLDYAVRYGRILMLATSKPTVFAKRILDYFDIARYFTFVAGSGLDGSFYTKGDVIRHVLESNNLTDHLSVVMIGDRKHDIIGAKENRLDSIGVLYGYGDREELSQAGADYIVEDIVGLRNLLFHQ